MSKQNGNKGRRFDQAFKEEAVRLLQTSGRRQRQIAGDLGISVSALGRWVAELRAEDLLSGPHEDAAKEITRLRRERDLARQERDLLKKSAGLLRQGKSMRFRFIDAERAGLAMPIFRLCRLRKSLMIYSAYQDIEYIGGTAEEREQTSMTQLYRLRSIDHVLGEYKELEIKEIYFAEPSELNDPMEGFRDIFWMGDHIVWNNLFRHYIYCLHTTCVISRFIGNTAELRPQHIPIMSDVPQDWTQKAVDLFLAYPVITHTHYM